MRTYKLILGLVLSNFMKLGTPEFSLLKRTLSSHVGSHGSIARSPPDRRTLPTLLKYAASTSNKAGGKVLHAVIVEMGLQSDPYIASSLINMYTKCDSLGNSVEVFARLPNRDAAVWNAMMSSYLQHGHRKDGFSCFRQMQTEGFLPDQYCLAILLGASGDRFSLGHGRQIHAYIVKNVDDPDAFSGTNLIGMYARCGEEDIAYKVFDKMPHKNVCMWNSMISGFSRNGRWDKSLELYAVMNNQGWQAEPATLSSVLTACPSGTVALVFGEMVYSYVTKKGYQSDPYVSSSLLTFYARCSSINDSIRMFDAVAGKGLGIWNSMISAYLVDSRVEEGLGVYTRMRRSGIEPDSFTISNMLSASAEMGSEELGRIFHGDLVKRPESTNPTVQSSMLTMYSKCGNINAAEMVFTSMKERDVVTWGSMITGLCRNLRFLEAMVLFKEMQTHGMMKQDSTMVAVMISGCVRSGGGITATKLGCLFHGSAVKSGTASDVYVQTALLDMYAKSGDIDSALHIFSTMPEKDRNIVVFNTMISGFSHNGQLNHAVATFIEVTKQNHLSPDSISIVNILAATPTISGLKMVHGYLVRRRIPLDVHANNALLDMYLKTGCLKPARHIFADMSTTRNTNTETWNSMIGGLGSNGCWEESMALFDEMNTLGIRPDNITFLCLISSCSHSGHVEEGLRISASMKATFGIEPGMDHYAGTVDLLGRAGKLNEAFGFINNMPVDPDSSVWRAFLNCSKTCKNVKMGELALDRLRKLAAHGVERSGDEVQLLSLYGEVGFPEKAAELRLAMREKGLRKNPGCSWIEVETNKVQLFYSGDSSSSCRTTEIYRVLNSLRKTMKQEPIPGRRFNFHDIHDPYLFL